jgi:hypothetical protein
MKYKIKVYKVDDGWFMDDKGKGIKRESLNPARSIINAMVEDSCVPDLKKGFYVEFERGDEGNSSKPLYQLYYAGSYNNHYSLYSLQLTL